jgi:hypothetical protein
VFGMAWYSLKCLVGVVGMVGVLVLICLMSFVSLGDAADIIRRSTLGVFSALFVDALNSSRMCLSSF